MRNAHRYSTIVSTLALVPYLAVTDVASSAPATATIPRDAVTIPVSAGPGFADGQYTGGTYDAYYGQVRTRVNIQGGQIVSIEVLDYPDHTGTSRYINRLALPMLKRQVIRAQDIRVNMVSGATLTSTAFLRSVYSALTQAGY